MDSRKENDVNKPAKDIYVPENDRTQPSAQEIAAQNRDKKAQMQAAENVTRQQKEAAYQRARAEREAKGIVPEARFNIINLLDDDIAQAYDHNQIDRSDAFFAQLIRNTAGVDEFAAKPKGKK